MTPGQARALLAAAGVPDPGGDAARLRRAFADETAFAAVVERRARREPVSQILGCRAFWTHDFIVTADVLDPRPETETLVEAALSAHFDRMLDLGTGSGCILLSLLAERGGATGTGTDLSPAALAVARRNAVATGVGARATFLRSDWLGSVEGGFDLIVSNPPYIADDEMAGLAPEVRDWEPHLALTPGGDGLDAYRRIAREAPGHLLPGGRLMVEIGPAQAAAVSRLFGRAGLTAVATIRDLGGRDRVICAEKSREC